MDAATNGHACSPVPILRCGDPGLSDFKGAVRDSAVADRRVPEKFTTARRTELGSGRLQHTVLPSANAECEPALSKQQRPAGVADRQHRHQIRGRRVMECPQAPWPESPDMAQDTHGVRRGDTGSADAA